MKMKLNEVKIKIQELKRNVVCVFVWVGVSQSQRYKC